DEMSTPLWIVDTANESVERVSATEVDVLEPGGDHDEAAQVAAILVGNRVVRIVAAYPGHAEAAFQSPRQSPAGDRADAAVGAAFGGREHAREPLLRQG